MAPTVTATYDVPMFESVILLTGDVEAPHLTDALTQAQAGAPVHHAADADRLKTAVATALPPILLIAYCTNVIVAPDVLDTIRETGGRAYNFHPATPHYPGVGGPQRAILDGAETFGVTLHVLDKKVDAGAIIAVSTFDVGEDMTGMVLEEKTYSALFTLFLKTLPDLLSADPPSPLADVAWGGQRITRSQLEAIKKAPPKKMDEATARRHARAFS